MTINLLLLILFLFLIFIMFLDYNNYAFNEDRKISIEDENFKDKMNEFKSKPKKIPITYEEQYKKKLNLEMDKAFVFYEQDICKDIKTENVFSLTQELTCKEMNENLKSIIKIINGKTNLDIKAKEWILKKLVPDKEYELEKKKNSKKKFDTLQLHKVSTVLDTSDLLVNNFVGILNDEFENTKYFDKYNKFHPYSSYKLEKYQILDFYTFKDLNRIILEMKLHRIHKIYDFVICVDIFYNQKKNILYYKNAFVRGVTNRFNTKYLEADDTENKLKYESFITDKMNDLIKQLEDSKNGNNELKYEKILEYIERYDLNKTFNQIIYYELLKMIEKTDISKNKNKNEKLYEKIIILFIENAEKILFEREETKPGLRNDIRFDKSQLDGKKVLTKELNVEVKKLNEKIKGLSFKDLSKIKFNELYPKFKCYNPLKKNEILQLYTNKIYCESYHSDIKVNGIWDRECEKDEDCPFFKANKNYPNNFGGCKKGSCDLPMGMSLIGGTIPSKYSVPMCYNCPDKKFKSLKQDSDCCYKQKKNKKLKSPDYMFGNDEKLRKQNKSNLLKLGLKP